MTDKGFVGLLGLTVWLVACGGGSTPAPKVEPPIVLTATNPPPTQPLPTATQLPPTATVVPTATPEPRAAAPSDAKQTIVEFGQAQLKAGPYRVKQTIESSQGKLEQIIEVILPDRFHIWMDMQGQKMEMLILPNKSFMKQGESKWQSFPVDIGQITQNFMQQISDDFEYKIADANYLGEQTINGEAANVYRYATATEFSGTKVVSTSTTWVSKRTGLPIRNEVEGEANGVKSKTIQEIEYDATIKIEEPK
jgi:hypothetical protein